mmetsp:Transcript_14515/g.42352  ORF Transcript_14515/g.42352 Transcript_14515/m.42352 type:complete len:368 (-) Transcript_14515:1466-2569(-)
MPRRWGAAGSTGACQLPALLDAADRGRQAVAQAGLPRRGGRVCPAAIRPRHDSVRRRGTRGAGARRCARSARAPPARVAAADAATAGGAVAGGRGSRRGHGARGGPRGVVPCCMSGYAVWQSALPHTGGAMPRLWPPQRLRRLLPGGQLKRRLLPAGRHKWQRGQPRRARAAGGAAVWLPGAEVAAAPWLRAAPAGGGACGAGRVQRPAGAAAAARHAWLESGGCGASAASVCLPRRLAPLLLYLPGLPSCAFFSMPAALSVVALPVAASFFGPHFPLLERPVPHSVSRSLYSLNALFPIPCPNPCPPLPFGRWIPFTTHTFSLSFHPSVPSRESSPGPGPPEPPEPPEPQEPGPSRSSTLHASCCK